MGRPRIIIIDTDSVYAERLALQFARMYENSIDLYVFTDIKIFWQVFREKQRADVLLLAEELQTQEIKELDIGRILLISEQNRTEGEKAILGRAMAGLQTDGVRRKDGKPVSVVGIVSAGSGAGSTSVSLALARFLSGSQQRVLYLNLESVQTFQYLLSDRSYLPLDACEQLRQGADGLYRSISHWFQTDCFSYLPALPVSPYTLGIPLTSYLNLIEEARQSNDFDTIILDLESGFSGNTGLLLGKCTDVVLLTKQDALSAYKTNIFLNNMDMGTLNPYMVCNQYNADFTVICSQYDPDFPVELYQCYFGQIPLSGSIGKLKNVSIEALANEKGLKELGCRFL